MVLGREHHFLEARVAQRAHPLIRIEMVRIDEIRALRTGADLEARVRIGSVVDERRELFVLPSQLTRRRRQARGSGDDLLRRLARHDGRNGVVG